MTSRLGPIEIGAREIFDVVVATRDAVTATRSAIDRLADRYDDTARDVADHEARLRGLERSRWPLPSLAVLISAGALLLALTRPGG